jgi:outer membrane receptor for ferrienterochelin and colicins
MAPRLHPCVIVHQLRLTTTSMKFLAIVTFTAWTCSIPSAAAAQAASATVDAPQASSRQTVPGDLSLQQLLETEVVSSASKFRQEVREAPASITVVTAEDIRRHGHRTLAEVLESVRGFYTTNDRNYTYIGVRGFARPGDYNTRVLLLLNGHRLNDPVYDMAPIGSDFPVDVSLIDHVEIIRGPGSSLYGTNAVFAVINVVTRSGGDHAGVRADASVGSLATTGATMSYGRVFAGNRELLVAGSAQRSDGAARLFFPEFTNIGSGSSEAVDLDDEDSVSVFTSAAMGPFSVLAGVGSRHKQVPTASFFTVFGDDRFTTRDTRAYANVTYDGPLGRGWSGTARVAYDHYDYEGLYPLDYELPEAVLWLDRAESQTVSSELTARRRLGSAHLLTVGTEARRQFRNHMSAFEDGSPALEVDRPGTVVGLYVQDEVRLSPWLLVNAGARVDRYPSFGSYATPRVGVVLLPRRATAVKLLHGRAFRAPNSYELYYYSPMREGGFTLSPEKIRSTELVWEETFSSRVRTSVSAFGYNVSALIEQGTVSTLAGDDLYFANVGDVEAVGLEGEIETRLARGVNLRFNHAAIRTRDTSTRAPVSNSPRHISKIGAQVPVSRLMLGFEGQYVGARLALDGERLPGFFVPNVTLTSPLSRMLEVTVGLYNAAGTRYADPGAEEHRQNTIPQDGRTLLARVRVGL